MSRRYNSKFTMFVLLKGHNVLEYYFDLGDAQMCANDWNHTLPGQVIQISRRPVENRLPVENRVST